MMTDDDAIETGSSVVIRWGLDEVVGRVVEVYGPPGRPHVVIELTPDISGDVVDEATTVSFPRSAVRPARHVVPSARGGWDVKLSGSEPSAKHFKTQADAAKHAKKIVSRAGGGSVIIHGKDGKVRDIDTVAADKQDATA